ncbi:MAG: AMP-binding protein [Gemmatimonadetes bacterium]|nr:AMP-binding protein [Gemmatimonadota bacterium]
MTEARPDEIAWRPDEATRRRARLTHFLEFCKLESFEQMYRRSIEDVAWFTDALLRYLEIPFDPPYARVVDLSRGIAWPRWCVGGGLNITRCLDAQALARGSQPAVLWEGEEGATRSLTYAELARDVSRCAAGLRALGLKPGDAIGLHLPMVPETAIALLAIGRIGGIAVPLFSGYGPQAIETRLNDVQASALFMSDGFPRRGKLVSSGDAAQEALSRCPSVKFAIHVSRANAERSTVPLSPFAALRAGSGEGTGVRWSDLLEKGQGGSEAEATAAEDPLLILYTSGTTGQPKGILHTHCGFPVKSAQDMTFGADVGPGDRILWVTDIGWMMGPWLIYGSIILGATMVFYDGAPDYPGPGRLWSTLSRHRVSVAGISPTLVRTLMAADALPGPEDDLSSLRIFAATGEPWNPDPWWWLFDKVGGRRVPLINYSGGTECSGGILMSNPLLPIKPCAFAAPCPGIAADVVDEAGQPVRGEVGELVIRQPWIGMARGFWKAPERYLETYWSRWPDTWVHGDWARLDEDGQWFILGRSDDTLKVSGKRVGPAEVESVLVAHPSVAEAAVVGVPDDLRGTAMIAFCVPRAGHAAGEKLSGELADLVGRELGKPLRPGRVVFIAALPKTRNAKVMRRLIRAAYLNEDPGDTSALENPGALAEIREAAVGRSA